MCGYGTRRNLNSKLVKYSTVLETEVYVMKTCAVENVDRFYKNRNICIPLDSRTASKVLGNYRMNSKLLGTDIKPSLNG
jgi:hypothetical protein